ncbi:hypothetical protein [Brevundimonas diminuta]
MVMVLDQKTNPAKSNEKLFSLPCIFLLRLRPVNARAGALTCHQDAIFPD